MAVIVGQGISVSPVPDAKLSHESTGTVQNKAVADAIAAEYSTSKTYSVGDVCTHDGKLYECIVDIPKAEGWTSAHWKVSNLGDVASDLNRQLSDVEENQIPELKSALNTVKYMGIVNSRGGYYGYIQYTFTVGHKYTVTNKTSDRINARTQTTGDSTGTAIENIASNIYAGESVVFNPTLPAEYARFWFNASGNVEIVDLSIGLPKAESEIVELSNEIGSIPTLYVKEQNSSLGSKNTSEYITDVAKGLYAWQQSVNLLSDGYLSHKNINASGELYDFETYATYDYFEVKGGRKIICTRNASTTTRIAENALWAFYSDKNEESFISRSTRSTNAVDIPQNAKYARVSIQNDYAVGNYGIMAEYTDGTNISPVYVPYFASYYQFLQPDFNGKKICAFGDSIAASDDGNRNAVTWIDLVKEYFGASEAYNRGIGTSCVTSTNAQGEARTGYAYVDADGDAGEVRRVYATQQSFANYPTEINPCMETVERVNTIPTDTDVVVIIAGTNDIGTTTLEMFESAYRTMLNNIIARVPNAKIYPCTMPFQQTYDLGDTATKAIYEGYRNVIRNVANDYGLPCIDLRKDMFVNARNYQTYMNDTTHYNTSAGRKRIAECVIAKLKGYSSL